MLSVKGKFERGLARPDESVSGREGQTVIITFLEAGEAVSDSGDVASWDALVQLLDECAIETGIINLAHQHDYYFYGVWRRK